MATKSDLPIILLAAGSSSRMRGKDKLLEDVGGVPLLRRQADVARAATSEPVIVALPPEPHARYAVLDQSQVIPTPIENAHKGLSESLKGALDVLPPDTPATMLLLADLPDLTVRDLRTVFDAVRPDSDLVIWRGTTEDGAPGHPIVVSAALFDALQATTGDTGGNAVMKENRHRTEFVTLPGQNALRDLDTPEDWAVWRSDQSSNP